MPTEVLPYTEEWVPGVRAFNERMHEAGLHWGWYTDPVDEWIPKREGLKTWREHYVAVEDGEIVRGAYALKPHEFLLRGEPHVLADHHGPITEAFRDPQRFSMLSMRLIRGMLKQQPLLYSWGHGEEGRPMVEMLSRMGWLVHATPVCLRVLHPARFLRRVRYLRTSPARRAALDALAWSGMGFVGIRALHAALSLRGSAPRAEIEVVPEFGAWADELWERCARQYTAVALRDAETMNALVPQEGWPPGIRLKVSARGQVIGWAVVLDTQMDDDRRFGSLRVGSIIDCLAAPADAPAVAGAAWRFLRDRGVDLAFTNQSHPAWVDGFARSGFVVMRDRRLFAASPQLKQAMEPVPETLTGLHLTNMDGHGPMRL